MLIYKPLINLLLTVSLLFPHNIMATDYSNDTNPALIDMYLSALKQKESSNRYSIMHTPSVITDFATGKPIKVQALGAYGILDINWGKWSKEAGLAGADWHDPIAQDRVAKYKVQQYFNKFGSWDAVSVAWFAGPKKAQRLTDGGTINFDEEDVKGTSIQQYVDAMNGLIAEELMNMEIPIDTGITKDMLYRGEPTGPMENLPQVGNPNRQMMPYDMYAAQVLDAMTKANAGGFRPSIGDYNSQVPSQAGDVEATQIKTNIRREEAK